MRTSRKIHLAAGACALSLLATAIPASAGDDGTKRVLAMVGSDTTTFVMDALATAFNINASNTDHDRVVNVPPLVSIAGLSEAAEAGIATRAWLAAARRGWPGGAVVPADADCLQERVYGGEGSYDANGNGTVDAGDRRFTTAQVDVDNDTTLGEVGVAGEVVQLGWVPPNGSGAGRTFALDTANNPVGCVDLVRSSSAPAAAQQPLFDTWGFALDAIGWVYFPGNAHGVTALTRDQLNQIYTCSAGTPTQRQISTWGQLSGNAADTTPIKAYRVQPGSGTGDDVASLLLGLTNNTQVGLNCTGAAATFPVVQEHDCTNVADVDKPDALCFYGYSRWRLQSRALEPDKRNGAKFGAFAVASGNTPLKPTPATITEAVGRYAGTRTVFSLIPKGSAGTGFLPGLGDALKFVGVVPSTGVDGNSDGDLLDAVDVPAPGGGQAVPGFACSSAAQTIIRTYGFVPFKLGITDATNGAYGSSFCRHNKYALT